MHNTSHTNTQLQCCVQGLVHELSIAELIISKHNAIALITEFHCAQVKTQFKVPALY